MARSTRPASGTGSATKRQRAGSGSRRPSAAPRTSPGQRRRSTSSPARPGQRRGPKPANGRRRNPNRWRFYALLALLGLIVAAVVWFTVGREAWASFMDDRGESAQEQPVAGDGAGDRENQAGETGDGEAGGADDGDGGAGGADDDAGAGGTQAGSGPEPAGSGTEEPDEDALANPVQCRSDAMRVQLDLGGTRHPAGEALPISVSVVNTGPVPCLVDLGHLAMQIEVTSGEDEIWTTAECPRGEGARDLLLDIDARAGHTVTWNGQRCGSDAAAQAGTYRISVSVPGSDGPARAGAVLELT